jgi:hypothetical protein
MSATSAGACASSTRPKDEDREKLASPEKVVGKFRVGFKDAFATFDRRGVGLRIRSHFGDITTHKQAKHGFGDVTTLHAATSVARPRAQIRRRRRTPQD